MIVRDSVLDLPTPNGPMRSYAYAPHDPHRPDATYPGVVLYSEIFQQTPPIRRLAVQLAGHGLVVLVPEVFHTHEPAGTVLGYDDAGKDKGNRYKYATPLATYDADARAALDALKTHPRCNGRLGTAGVCLGGHLALRAALNPGVRAAAGSYRGPSSRRNACSALNSCQVSRTPAVSSASYTARRPSFGVCGSCRPHTKSTSPVSSRQRASVSSFCPSPSVAECMSVG